MLLLEQAQGYMWLPTIGIGVAVCWMLFMLFRILETSYAQRTDKLLYRDLLVFRSLSRKQKDHLSKDFSFYNTLAPKHQARFEHRVATFIKQKEFIGRDGLVVTESMKLIIAAVGCMLTFGRRQYTYQLIDHILIYPEPFYSAVNDAYHKGEFNPRQKAVVLSWPDFEEGYRITDDNLNLGIHEFMHALQLDALTSRDLDALRFEKRFKLIFERLKDTELRERLDKVKYFRAYAFTNQYEFMAVLAEYFFESPEDFETHFPQVYNHTKILLNYDFGKDY
jgi:Mlc titration factor MtfA (ptsG expression regulator)